jgi:hypothetical protein
MCTKHQTCPDPAGTSQLGHHQTLEPRAPMSLRTQSAYQRTTADVIIRRVGYRSAFFREDSVVANTATNFFADGPYAHRIAPISQA